MNAIALLLWVSAFSSICWGAVRFFRRRSRPTAPTVLIAILALLFGGWHAYAVATSNARVLWMVLGVALLALSMTLFWAAVRAYGPNRPTPIFEADLPRYLTDRGPYRYIRHPFYSSYSIFWFAGGIASGSTAALLSAAIMLGLYLVAAHIEEGKFAASGLAADYAAYRRRTGMMVPRLLTGDAP